MSDDARQKQKMHSRGPNHDVGVSSTIEEYEAFLQRLAYDSTFRNALAANPIPTLAQEGIKLPHGNAPRLKEVVGCLGIPPVHVIEDHIQGLEDLQTREEICDKENLTKLLTGLADPTNTDLRKRLSHKPRQTLAEFGIDFDELDFEGGETIELPPAEELAELIQQNHTAGIRLVNRIRRYHFQLEWYLLTTGGRSY